MSALTVFLITSTISIKSSLTFQKQANYATTSGFFNLFLSIITGHSYRPTSPALLYILDLKGALLFR